MRCRDSSNSSVTFVNCGTVCSLHKRHSCLQITSVQQWWGPICFLSASFCLTWLAGEYQLVQSARPPGLVFWEAQLTGLGSNALVCLADLGKLNPKCIAPHLHFSSKLWRAVGKQLHAHVQTFQGSPTDSHYSCLQILAALGWVFVRARAINTISFNGGCQGSENYLMSGLPWLLCLNRCHIMWQYASLCGLPLVLCG